MCGDIIVWLGAQQINKLNVTVYSFGLWAVFDIRMGRFGCSCGPFWTSMRAVLDLAMGRFCPSRGPFWFMGRFGIDPVTGR